MSSRLRNIEDAGDTITRIACLARPRGCVISRTKRTAVPASRHSYIRARADGHHMVTRPIFFAFVCASANHTAPSGPLQIPIGSAFVVGIAYWVKLPLVVSRPIAFTLPGSPNHSGRAHRPGPRTLRSAWRRAVPAAHRAGPGRARRLIRGPHRQLVTGPDRKCPELGSRLTAHPMLHFPRAAAHLSLPVRSHQDAGLRFARRRSGPPHGPLSPQGEGLGVRPSMLNETPSRRTPTHAEPGGDW